MGIFSRFKRASPKNSLSTSSPFFFGRSPSDVDQVKEQAVQAPVPDKAAKIAKAEPAI